jgi:formate hydrogenlyase subunit 3/multisubunit Na+/H+ antiporter MnhD subunit
MFPFVFEWKWSADHYIFLGLLYLALTIIGFGLVYSFLKTWLDLPDHEKSSESPPGLSYRSRYSDY